MPIAPRILTLPGPAGRQLREKLLEQAK
jgi:hypothetical protein